MSTIGHVKSDPFGPTIRPDIYTPVDPLGDTNWDDEEVAPDSIDNEWISNEPHESDEPSTIENDEQAEADPAHDLHSNNDRIEADAYSAS